MRKILAVLDVEKEYAERFMTYLNERRSFPFEVQVFTSVEGLLQFASGKEIEILLVSERAYTEQVREITARQTILLTENGMQKDVVDFPTIYKYQASQRVVREVMDCYGAECSILEAERMPGGAAELVGVIGMSDPDMRTVFAAVLGQILAEKKPVLYISLDRFGALAEVFREDEGDAQSSQGLSDLLYRYRRNKEGLAVSLAGMVRRLKELDVLLPAADPDDLTVMTEKEWKVFFSDLRKLCGYASIVVEFDGDPTAMEELVRGCTELYLVENDGYMGQIRAKRYMEQVGLSGQQVKIVNIPFIREGEGIYYLEKQVLGKTGESIRKMLKEDEDTGSKEKEVFRLGENQTGAPGGAAGTIGRARRIDR